MFSLDDDSFELNEDDFLQAAINVEEAAKTSQGNGSSFPVKKDGLEIRSTNNNLSSVQDNLFPKNGERQIQGPLFSIGGEGDDSVFDLSLDSPVKWNAGGLRRNEPPSTSTPFGIAVQNPSPNLLAKRKSLGDPSALQSQCTSRLNVQSGRGINVTTSNLTSSKFNKFNEHQAPQHDLSEAHGNISTASFRHGGGQGSSEISEFSSPQPGTSTIPDPQRPHVFTKKHTNAYDSPFNDSEESPSFSTPKNVRTSKPKRKFPGPAGLLPKLKPGENLAELTSVAVIPEVVSEKPVTEDDLPSSQCSEDQFQDGLWPEMLRELEPPARKLIKEFPINSINRKAHKKQLPNGKVPVLGAVIESINFKNSDASVTLKDPSGRIRGTMHRELIKEFGNILQPGSVLVLRQIGVFNPLSRNHYLNITPSNVVRIYCYNIEDNSKSVVINKFVPEDFDITSKSASPSVDMNRINLTNSPLNDMPRMSNSPLATQSLPWNTIGRGMNHGTPRPSNFIRSPAIRPTQPTRFVRTPQVAGPAPSTPRSNFVRHSYGTPSVVTPADGASQGQHNSSATLSSGVMSDTTIRAQGSQRNPVNHAMRPAAPVDNASTQSQTVQNNDFQTPRLRTPKTPSFNVRTPAQAQNSGTPNSQNVAGNNNFCRPRTSLLRGNVQSQNSMISNVSNLNNSSDSASNVSAIGTHSNASTFRTPQIPEAPRFKPPFNSTAGNLQPIANQARTPVNNICQSSMPSSNIIQSQPNMQPVCSISSDQINQPTPKPQTPGKFTFKRKAVNTPGADTAKKQQVAAPSRVNLMDCRNLQNIDPHEDLLAGLEHELLDDDF